jgi:hypothetical protein
LKGIAEQATMEEVKMRKQPMKQVKLDVEEGLKGIK